METSYYVPVEGDAAVRGAAQASDRLDDSGPSRRHVEYFVPTSATVSVWADDIQHGGPPTGLLMRSLLRCAPDPDQRFTRVTTEILGPIGLGLNRVSAYVIRPGRQISMVGADLEVRLSDGSFRLAARATAWRFRSGSSADIVYAPNDPLVPTPDTRTPQVGLAGGTGLGADWGTTGFIGATETVVVPGRRGTTAAIWVRPTLELVEGEAISDLESVMTVVDVANGLGTALSPADWTWMNTDTTVHFSEVPTGPWLGIDAEMAVGASGFGTTYADLYSASGFVGRSAQTVLLRAVTHDGRA